MIAGGHWVADGWGVEEVLELLDRQGTMLGWLLVAIGLPDGWGVASYGWVVVLCMGWLLVATVLTDGRGIAR